MKNKTKFAILIGYATTLTNLNCAEELDANGNKIDGNDNKRRVSANFSPFSADDAASKMKGNQGVKDRIAAFQTVNSPSKPNFVTPSQRLREELETQKRKAEQELKEKEEARIKAELELEEQKKKAEEERIQKEQALKEEAEKRRKAEQELKEKEEARIKAELELEEQKKKAEEERIQKEQALKEEAEKRRKAELELKAKEEETRKALVAASDLAKQDALDAIEVEEILNLLEEDLTIATADLQKLNAEYNTYKLGSFTSAGSAIYSKLDETQKKVKALPAQIEEAKRIATEKRNLANSSKEKLLSESLDESVERERIRLALRQKRSTSSSSNIPTANPIVKVEEGK